MENALNSKEAILGIIDKLRNSNIMFKQLYLDNAETFTNIENNIDAFLNDVGHLNSSMNTYKWILFTSKTKEQLFENIDSLIKRPDGTPAQFTDEQKELLFKNSKALQMFFILLELSRNKCEKLNLTKEDWDKVMKKEDDMNTINAHNIIKTSLAGIPNNIISDGDSEISDVTPELNDYDKEYNKYKTHIQNGGNNNRMIKLCYQLDKPLPLKLPTMDFLNFSFDATNDKMCLDIEYPWWPTMPNMLPELFNKSNIKQCLRDTCVANFKNDKIKDSPEKQECVKQCFMNAEASPFDFMFFPLWSIKKYDPFGVVGSGINFGKFFLNQLDANLGRVDPLMDKIFGYVIEAIGFIPIFGDIVNWVMHTLDDYIDNFGDSVLKWIDAYINLQEKNFEEAFAIYATTMPNATAEAKNLESTKKVVDALINGGFSKGAVAMGNKALDFAGKMNLGNLAKMLQSNGPPGNPLAGMTPNLPNSNAPNATDAPTTTGASTDTSKKTDTDTNANKDKDKEKKKLAKSKKKK
jgi:hypothetical protein